MANLTEEEQTFIDTIFSSPMSKQELEDTLNRLIAALITNKPININTIGDLQELRLLWPVL